MQSRGSSAEPGCRRARLCEDAGGAESPSVPHLSSLIHVCLLLLLRDFFFWFFFVVCGHPGGRGSSWPWRAGDLEKKQLRCSSWANPAAVVAAFGEMLALPAALRGRGMVEGGAARFSPPVTQSLGVCGSGARRAKPFCVTWMKGGGAGRGPAQGTGLRGQRCLMSVGKAVHGAVGTQCICMT